MRVKVASFLLLMALAAPGATPDVGKEKLRKLAKLPSITLETGWKFDRERGFIIEPTKAQKAAAIAEARKSLQGDNTDAGRFFRLGQLCRENREDANAGAAFSQAVELYRQRAASQPGDGLLLTELGRALAASGRFDESQSVLREAVRLAPKEWKCWTALGQSLDDASITALFGPMGANGDNPEFLAARILKSKPSSDQLNKSQKLLGEAGVCFDKAASVAPEEADPYFRRGLHRCLESFERCAARIIRGDENDDTAPRRSWYPWEALPDFQKASRLEPDSYAAVAGLAIFECHADAAQKGKAGFGREFSWSSLSEKTRQSVREMMTRLENLGQSRDPQLASGALEALGMFQGPILRDYRGSAVSLRHAVSLDPSREQAWDMLASMLAKTDDHDELLSVCEERARKKDSAHNRLMLAKAYEKLNQWDSAEEQVLTALNLDANDFTASLAMAVLLIKRSQNASVLADADGWLVRAEQLYGKLPDKGRQQSVDLTLARSIYLALTDNVETARTWVKHILETDQNNEFARE
ncbi:MAG TPA: tetratricopeptide repeat protein, partial [Verrucomicrobiae bacterium]|nr:tetratricopeptide repeat protein [Verrucomicrobiae bacterium]